MISSDRYFQRFLVPMVHPMPFGGLDMQPWLKGGAVGESGGCTWPIQALSSKGDCVTRPGSRRHGEQEQGTQRGKRCFAWLGRGETATKRELRGRERGSYIGILGTLTDILIDGRGTTQGMLGG